MLPNCGKGVRTKIDLEKRYATDWIKANIWNTGAHGPEGPYPASGPAADSAHSLRSIVAVSTVCSIVNANTVSNTKVKSTLSTASNTKRKSTVIATKRIEYYFEGATRVWSRKPSRTYVRRSPHLLYSCESWKLTQTVRRKLYSTASKMLWRITGSSIKNET